MNVNHLMAVSMNELNNVLFLLQKIESIIDTRLIGEVEPLNDEIEVIEGYQNRKKDGTLELYEL